VTLVCLDARLVERVDAQQVAAEGARLLEEVEQRPQTEGVQTLQVDRLVRDRRPRGAPAPWRGMPPR